jgi:cell division protein FtsW
MTGSRVERNGTSSGPAPEAALLAAVVGLSGFGLVMIHSTTAPMAGTGILGVSPHFVRHLAALAAAASGAWLVSQMPLRFWRLIALPFWAGTIVLLAFTLIVGVEVNGARRGLTIPGIGVRFQPAEIAKLATVLAVAALCARNDARPNSPRRLWAPALLALIPAGLLIRQPDLGNAVVVVVLTCSLLFVAGTPLRVFTLPAVVGTLLVSAYVFTTSYAWKRLTGFLDPWARADAEGFQLVQSFVGFARGGLTGVGIGDGRQKLYYLPEAHTDFILAVVAEEAGFLGVLAVLGAFVALVIAGLQVARRAQDRFAMLLAFGATMLLALPAVLNTAVVTGSVPPKGLPLPFLSYGRTALVAAFFAAGLLIAVARQAPAETQRFRK